MGHIWAFRFHTSASHRWNASESKQFFEFGISPTYPFCRWQITRHVFLPCYNPFLMKVHKHHKRTKDNWINLSETRSKYNNRLELSNGSPINYAVGCEPSLDVHVSSFVQLAAQVHLEGTDIHRACIRQELYACMASSSIPVGTYKRADHQSLSQRKPKFIQFVK
jgi:hypothetical protein